MDKMLKFLLEVVIILVLASIISFVVNAVVGPYAADPVFTVIWAFVGLAVLYYVVGVQKAISVDNLSWFRVLVLLVALLAIGSAIKLVLPDVGVYLLDLSNLTISGFAWTIAYIGIAEWVAKMIGIK